MKTNTLHPCPQRNFLIISCLFFVALGIRAFFALYILDIGRPISGDEGGYHWRGEVIGRDLTFGASAYRPPFVGLTLAPFYAIFDSHIEVGRWLMVLVSALCTPIIYFLGRAVTKNHTLSLIAAIFWIFYPPSIWYSVWIHTETWSALLVALSIYLYYKSVSTNLISFSSLLGLSWAFLALNRSVFVFLPLVFFLLTAFKFFRKDGERLSFPQLLVSLLLFFLAMSPWTLHNYVVHNKFIPHSTQGGTLLLICNGDLDQAHVRQGGYHKNYSLLQETETQGKTEVKIDDIRRKLGFEAIFHNLNDRPMQYLLTVVNRGLNFWTFRPDPFDPNWTRNDLIMAIIWLPILLCLPFSPLLRNWQNHLPLLIMIFYCFAFVLPFWGSPRFRYPVDPLIIIAGLSGAPGLWNFVIAKARLVKLLR